MKKFNELVDGRNAQDTQRKISQYFIESGHSSGQVVPK